MHSVCEFLGLLNYPKQFHFGCMLCSRGTSFKWLFARAGWLLAKCACPGWVSSLTGCDSRGCLVLELSRIRNQNKNPGTQTYVLSAKTSPKSAVNMGDSWCWAQLRGGSQKRPATGPQLFSQKLFFSLGISSNLLLKHMNSLSLDSAQSLSSGNPTWVESIWKDKAIHSQLICQAADTVHLK